MKREYQKNHIGTAVGIGGKQHWDAQTPGTSCRHTTNQTILKCIFPSIRLKKGTSHWRNRLFYQDIYFRNKIFSVHANDKLLCVHIHLFCIFAMKLKIQYSHNNPQQYLQSAVTACVNRCEAVHIFPYFIKYIPSYEGRWINQTLLFPHKWNLIPDDWHELGCDLIQNVSHWNRKIPTVLHFL